MISIDEINKLKEENSKLNAIIDGYQPKIQALKDENFELKESLKCFQKPEVVKVLTDYRTGEIDNLKAENERLKEENFNWEQINKLQEKYYQTLQEIKEICKNSHTSTSEDYYRTADKIIQKITKAEE